MYCLKLKNILFLAIVRLLLRYSSTPNNLSKIFVGPMMVLSSFSLFLKTQIAKMKMNINNV